MLIAKLHAYGFNKKTFTFLYSYLKRRKQSVKINDTESFFQILLSGVHQVSVLGSIFFNLFINNLFFFIKEAELSNFADDNTMNVGSKDLTDLLEVLQKECETAINWFKKHIMIVNPDTCQSMIYMYLKKDLVMYLKKDQSKSVLNMKGVELLGIEIGNKLNFEKHISNICKKASF